MVIKKIQIIKICINKKLKSVKIKLLIIKICKIIKKNKAYSASLYLAIIASSNRALVSEFSG